MEEKRDKSIDLSKVLADHESKWVVLSRDYQKVIASGETVDDILSVIDKGIAMLVPRFDSTFVPTSLTSR